MSKRGEYKEYSRTSSGWTISTNPAAPPDKRWRIVHPVFGERFFANRMVGNRNIILEFTVAHLRDQFLKMTGQ